ncbi:uncharacterized protein LOC119096285 [Pollicipes pollicipes]|uniref:uncharacterized protein LOC119096285 n=1 Tax=Pollicipes pollicipes TaxID=41117 RepID=UPI0018850D8E|nr:uncharacterized protein LOC119096285 [Pollicipes pollicipes]
MQYSGLLLLIGAAVAAADPPVQPWLDAYDGQHQAGNMITYHDSASSLGHWNDLMRSACLNGFWVFFEHDQFNYQAGRVIWSYGFNYCFTFKADFDKQVSSVRRIGDFYDAGADSLSLYEGTYYSGNQVFTKSYLTSIGTTYGYSSVLVTGPDAWTIYTGDNYTGQRVCLYSGSDTAVSPSGQKIEWGLFPTADYLGVVGSNIRSARKGCYSSTKLRGLPLTAANHLSNFVVVEEEAKSSGSGGAGGN